MAFRKVRPVKPPVKKTRVNWRIGEAKRKLDDALTEFELRRTETNHKLSRTETTWSSLANEVAQEYSIPRKVFRRRVFSDEGFKVFLFHK